ncbi:MAG: phosphoribosylamine--glycine ligase [Candidatus Contendobacter odensis]|uniref:Phosphoribosylamine--glycine ligase n=1 Tax=Candidatus Contendibacter odensensis TaxID=1400860 RepID=A0A2G6PH02_9GAMM|nr:MAG: phosphoribosylamine--glycine ligase [Candidatus Contendobacter odensis]
MNVLIVGSGGREHALAWKVAQSNQVNNVYVAPGNAGTARESKARNIAIAADDIPALVRFAAGHHVDLTLIGPEVPLVMGIVDAFEAAGLPCFGPNKVAAQLEGSKAFTKDFLARHHIPTARYQSFTDADEAEAYIREMGAPIVVKADGLAAGKGVILAQGEDEAITAVRGMLSGTDFGDAGRRVVVEEFLQGEEASFIVMTDGQHILPLASSQDHKARDDGDSGPNTGGMGAYSPAPVVTPEMHQKIMVDVIEPTVRGLAAEGCHYVGFLYAGLMIDGDQPRVLEYNCRLGDPEAQPLLLRLRSDLVDLCKAALAGRLHEIEAEWDSRVALGVVMAAGGYPGDCHKGDVIEGLSHDDSEFGHDVKLFHAGTQATKEGHVVTSGGRVLCATALGGTVAEAQNCAYTLVRRVHWNDAYYRTDIGYRAIARERRE